MTRSKRRGKPVPEAAAAAAATSLRPAAELPTSIDHPSSSSSPSPHPANDKTASKRGQQQQQQQQQQQAEVARLHKAHISGLEQAQADRVAKLLAREQAELQQSYPPQQLEQPPQPLPPLKKQQPPPPQQIDKAPQQQKQPQKNQPFDQGKQTQNESQIQDQNLQKAQPSPKEKQKQKNQQLQSSAEHDDMQASRFSSSARGPSPAPFKASPTNDGWSDPSPPSQGWADWSPPTQDWSLPPGTPTGPEASVSKRSSKKTASKPSHKDSEKAPAVLKGRLPTPPESPLDDTTVAPPTPVANPSAGKPESATSTTIVTSSAGQGGTVPKPLKAPPNPIGELPQSPEEVKDVKIQEFKLKISAAAAGKMNKDQAKPKVLHEPQNVALVSGDGLQTGDPTAGKAVEIPQSPGEKTEHQYPEASESAEPSPTLKEGHSAAVGQVPNEVESTSREQDEDLFSDSGLPTTEDDDGLWRENEEQPGATYTVAPRTFDPNVDEFQWKQGAQPHASNDTQWLSREELLFASGTRPTAKPMKVGMKLTRGVSREPSESSRKIEESHSENDDVGVEDGNTDQDMLGAEDEESVEDASDEEVDSYEDEAGRQKAGEDTPAEPQFPSRPTISTSLGYENLPAQEKLQPMDTFLVPDSFGASNLSGREQYESEDFNFGSLIDVPALPVLKNPVLDISGKWFCDKPSCINRDRPEFIGICYREPGNKLGHVMVVSEALNAWIEAMKKDENVLQQPGKVLRETMIEAEATAYTNEVIKGSDHSDFLNSMKRYYGRFEIPAREELKRFFSWLKSRNPNEDFSRTEDFLLREQCDLHSVLNDFTLEMWRELKLPIGLFGRLRREVEAFQRLSELTLRSDDALSTSEKQAVRDEESKGRLRKGGYYFKKDARLCDRCGKTGHYTEYCGIIHRCENCGKLGHPTESCWNLSSSSSAAKRTWWRRTASVSEAPEE